MIRVRSLACAGAVFLATAGLGSGDVSLNPVSCEAEPPGSYESPGDTSVTICPGVGGGPDLLLFSGPDLSWPVLRSADDLRSFEDDLLDALQPFGAGLLFYRSGRQTVWVVSDARGQLGHIVSMTGNDPVTLERRPAFVSVPSRPDRRAGLHVSLGEALDSLIPP